MRRWISAAAIVAALSAVPAVTASPDGSSWVRRELQHFVVYLPNNDWNTAESANGVDITSEVGEYNVTFGFSAWTAPLKVNEVAAYFLKLGGYDAHPLAGARLTPQGPAFALAKGVTRRIFTLTGTRTDRRERIRGVVTVDVYNYPDQGVYAYDAYSRVAPAAAWQRMASTLLAIQKAIVYKPKAPTCLRWEPGCPPRRK